MLRNINIVIKNYNCKYFETGIYTLIDTIYNKFKLQSEYIDKVHGFNVIFTQGHFNPFRIRNKNVIIMPVTVDIKTVEVLFRNLREGSPIDLKEVSLSNCERKILVLFILGKKDDEISSTLSINIKTVSSHKTNIKNKISANTRIDLFYAFNEFFDH